jgi:hypothetical protein
VAAPPSAGGGDGGGGAVSWQVLGLVLFLTLAAGCRRQWL